MATRSKSAGLSGDAISGASLVQLAPESRPAVHQPGAFSHSERPSDDELRPSEARLYAVLEAAQRLAEAIEDEISPSGFALVTAMQCVLKEAESIARDLLEGGAE